MPLESTPATARTLAWLEHAVIGLNLCPFAKAPHAKGLVRCVESPADDPASLVGDLVTELERMTRTPPERLETTLLVHPQVFTDFDDFNDFLGVVEVGNVPVAPATDLVAEHSKSAGPRRPDRAFGHHATVGRRSGR